MNVLIILTLLLRKTTMNVGLYAICSNDDMSLIKIGRITGSIGSLLSQYSTRYHPQGYQILRYWHGSEYYNIEHKVHNHPKLSPARIRNDKTARLTEWFRIPLNIIDDVVHEVVNLHRKNTTEVKEIRVTTIRPVIFRQNPVPLERPVILQQNPVPLERQVIFQQNPVPLERPVILQQNPVPLEQPVVFQQTPVQLQHNPVVLRINTANKDTFRYSDFINDVCIIDPHKYISSSDLYKYY